MRQKESGAEPSETDLGAQIGEVHMICGEVFGDPYLH